VLRGRIYSWRVVITCVEKWGPAKRERKKFKPLVAVIAALKSRYVVVGSGVAGVVGRLQAVARDKAPVHQGLRKATAGVAVWDR